MLADAYKYVHQTSETSVIRHLPFFDPTVDDEFHMLFACPQRPVTKTTIPEEVLSDLLQLDLKSIFNIN